MQVKFKPINWGGYLPKKINQKIQSIHEFQTVLVVGLQSISNVNYNLNEQRVDSTYLKSIKLIITLTMQTLRLSHNPIILLILALATTRQYEFTLEGQ